MGASSQPHQVADFQIVENVKIGIRVELDHRMISFRELMSLSVDSILELRRPTGENVDIYFGNVLAGHGEILVIDRALAIRVADLRRKSNERMERPLPVAGAVKP
jgi:flagellar motor switch/type III secretory pathway protein FliN